MLDVKPSRLKFLAALKEEMNTEVVKALICESDQPGNQRLVPPRVRPLP